MIDGVARGRTRARWRQLALLCGALACDVAEPDAPPEPAPASGERAAAAEPDVADAVVAELAAEELAPASADATPANDDDEPAPATARVDAGTSSDDADASDDADDDASDDPNDDASDDPNDDASDEPSDAEADAHDEAAPARRYSIAPTSIRIQGPIDREMARRVFKRHRRSLEACAARVAAAGDDPRGTLALQLHLTDTPDAVRAVVVTEDKTRSRGKLASCVKQRLREWSWPTSYVCGAAIMHVTLRVR